ncbi:MAG: ADP-ribosylglycohydrolase family protein, partial [Planctomycetota bacterium]
MATPAITLREKFRGCIAATWVGSAMGAAVEGWPPENIRAEHGLLEKLLPYKHYTHVTYWLRPPGTTEDAIERQRLVATAIIEKPGRILAHDPMRVWLRDLDPEKVKYKQEAFDLSLLEMARAGVPPSELGKLWPFPNVVSVSRATHPLGLINAGDPRGAADDTFEVGKVYSRETTACLRWAAMYNACIAEACRPGASVESVLETAREFSKYRAEGGGWVVDQQFVDQMGSPYLLAHGMGEPVADARTTVTFPAAGTYRVHVRTKDWVPSFADGPGKFRVSVAGKELAHVFGMSRRGWGWEEGGTVELAAGTVEVALKDITGFEGRCDAVYFTTSRGAVPPNSIRRMTPWRRRLLGLPETPPPAGEFDLVVVGGGISGCCAALQAARLGLTVALIHDRPWLGGNASREVRVHTLGES